MSRSDEILVVGAGVHGLSSAFLLAEAGTSVRVVAEKGPQDTTSAVAAALWYPYHASPRERVGGWARRSYLRFTDLAGDPETGIRMVSGVEVARTPRPGPEWGELLPGWRSASAEELPAGCETGFVFEVPVIEMPLYLDWLLGRCEALGVRFELGRRLATLDDALAECSTVVDCTGLGAREFAGDERVHPIRGQIQRLVRGEGSAARFLLDEDDPAAITYVIPRSGDIVLGGTLEVNDDDLAPRAESARSVRSRCLALEPTLAELPVAADVVGLRPGRDAVRLERETREDGSVVVHDYGHGGAGVTLSWGCAEEVRDLCLAGVAGGS